MVIAMSPQVNADLVSANEPLVVVFVLWFLSPVSEEDITVRAYI